MEKGVSSKIGAKYNKTYISRRIDVVKELFTESPKARLFLLKPYEVNGYHVKKGTTIWIPKSQIIKAYITKGEADFVMVKEDFYKKIIFIK